MICLFNHPKNGFRLVRYHIIYFLLKDAALTSAAFSSTNTAILIVYVSLCDPEYTTKQEAKQFDRISQ